MSVNRSSGCVNWAHVLCSNSGREYPSISHNWSFTSRIPFVGDVMAMPISPRSKYVRKGLPGAGASSIARCLTRDRGEPAEDRAVALRINPSYARVRRSAHAIDKFVDKPIVYGETRTNASAFPDGARIRCVT